MTSGIYQLAAPQKKSTTFQYKSPTASQCVAILIVRAKNQIFLKLLLLLHTKLEQRHPLFDCTKAVHVRYNYQRSLSGLLFKLTNLPRIHIF